MNSVLVVDDEAPIQRALSANLEARDYDVFIAGSGEQALELAARHHPDLVILDLGLPGIDGVEVVRGLRRWTNVPIIILSARGAEADKVAALDAGADDYVAKPFGMDELLARVRSALRRTTPADEAAVIDTAHFRVDLADRRVTDRAGRVVRLTPTEWGLLEVLVRNADRLVVQKHLLREVWGPDFTQQSNYLRVHMAHLRRKLEPNPSQPRYLVTEPGMGYRFVNQVGGAGA
jgi:two-component system KDP operon response regulator KdpE